jgi:NtrC-family two-component system response regulator AlgB
MRHFSALIVDDERNIRQTLRVCLEALGADVVEASSAPAAIEAMRRGAFELVFTDLRLGAESGLDLIPELLAESPEAAIVMITAYASVETAAEAMRRGARDYLAKPFTPTQVRQLVARTRQAS